jgi:hypothetical protein
MAAAAVAVAAACIFILSPTPLLSLDLILSLSNCSCSSLLHWHAAKVAENAEEHSTLDEFSMPEPMVWPATPEMWNPKRNEILSGSEDGTTSLWKVSDDACSAEIGARCVS